MTIGIIGAGGVREGACSFLPMVGMSGVGICGAGISGAGICGAGISGAGICGAGIPRAGIVKEADRVPA